MNRDLLVGISLVIVILGAAIYSAPANVEGFVSTGDYTTDYTNQIEAWAAMEETSFKLPIEQLATANGYAVKWKPGVDKSTIAARREGLPDASAYLEALVDIDRLLTTQLSRQDEELEMVPDMNRKIIDKQVTLKNAVNTLMESTTLPSLSSLRDRGQVLIRSTNDIASLMIAIDAKMAELKMNRAAPDTAEKIIDYEINKFAKPMWAPLKLVVERVAKLLASVSSGSDGQSKISEAAATDLALKEIAAGSKVNDFADFYKMMAAADGAPKATVATLKDLFEDPLGYINVLKYIQESGSKVLGIAGFADLGAEAVTGKCTPCLLEPEVKDIDALRRRYVVLRDSYKQFKEILMAVQNTLAKVTQLEKKAESGELMNEMIASGKYKVD
jgi:hypothetical protein